MKSVAFFFALLVAAANAFVIVPQTQQRVLFAAVDEEIDYDAPIERAFAVGNVVESEKVKLMGVEVPDFISRAFNLRTPSGGPSLPMDLDDECYLGKDGDAEDCVDFDP
ncbi:expressed unknown protein [Seminavis robusta]|uniref:Uncharacterized protein n=1 Tax=Seminavis robusta TaxID=568900 RepID=A0A9N8H6X4_9STRA|nr:expressed unknown protein [Seminavis robusta]|eukprot:Sro160_g072270.1 n/a (109) ;mRNA; r:80425-80904